MCLPSVKFREIPWQMLLLGFLSVSLLLSFPCNSVASLLLLLGLISVKFRVNPWQKLLLGFPLFLPSVASASAAFCLLSRHKDIINAKMLFFPIT